MKIDASSNPCPKCGWPRNPWLCTCIAPPGGGGSGSEDAPARNEDALDIDKAKQSLEVSEQDLVNTNALRNSDKEQVIEEVMDAQEFASILEQLSEILKVKDEHDKGVFTIEGNWGLSKEQDQALKEFLNTIKLKFDRFKNDSKDKGANFSIEHDEDKNKLIIKIPNTKFYDEFTQKVIPPFFNMFLQKLINSGLLHSHHAEINKNAGSVKRRKPHDPKPPTSTDLTRS